MSKCGENYIETKDLGAFAAKTAENIKISKRVSGKRAAEKCMADLKYIGNINKAAALYAADEAALPQDIEWLLDNFYLSNREGIAAAEDIKNIKNLRAVCGDSKTSVTETIASMLVKAGNGEVTEERMRIFLEAFQSTTVLCENELRSFIPAVKIALIAFLKSSCKNIEKTINGDKGNDILPCFMENIFTSLRFMGNFDPTDMLSSVNKMEEVLCRDPAGVYPNMDEDTKALYRNEIVRLAEKNSISQYEAAKKILDLAERKNQHIGKFIFALPLGKRKKEKNGALYISSVILSSLFFTILLGFLLENPVVSVLLFFPISEIVKNVLDFFIIKFTAPFHIARMDMEKGVPKDGKTICVISALLSSESGIDKCVRLLEEYKLSNRDSGENLLFGILADLPEADKKHRSEDDKLIKYAAEKTEALNDKYGGGFYFLRRERAYNETSGKYMGWERKRGAILELVRLLKGKNTSIVCECGSISCLSETKFIITLDSDTRLCAGTAAELIGAALHPLNLPEIDEKKKIVVSGRGIFQPRISMDLEAANTSDFTRIFAGQGGTDPYNSAVSDVYQDLFSGGSFAGKGLINIDAYEKCLDGRFPDNRILSHDLLEGAYLNCAYVGDTEFTDGYPYKLTSFYDRMHRWVRGDWQILPWLFSKVKTADGKKEPNPLNDLNKWKIFDNLRRSLVPVFTFAALLAGMLISKKAFCWAAVAAVISVISNLLLSSADMLFRRRKSTGMRYHSTIISGFGGWLIQTIIRLMFLPYEAWICFSAAVTALYRMVVSKKNLLQWVTSSEAEMRATNKVWENYRKMWICCVAGAVIICITPYISTITIGIVWLLTPLYAGALSKKIKENRKISELDRMYLLNAAGDIWKYFDDFLTAEDNFLPPDNWQQQPSVGIAHRTSPTNIGLALLSIVSAYDLKILDKDRAISKIRSTLSTVLTLKKWHGHLYNWYDTRSMQILDRGYISTVDSGNLAGSLIVLHESLLEMGERELSEMCRKILDDMDFKPLFDSKRKLFYIGWDMAKNGPTEGWYDLLASEARQTSYIAIARGDVPRKHWRRLGRALVSQDNYSGMVSWTGTMFEYFMPNLILPCYKNSLLYESLKFCLYAQKKKFKPWGISESAFYSFDPSMSYRYKAHGVQSLALKRKMDTEIVISPYSTFLALAVDVKGSIKNLKRLEKMGMTERYGFYEAADFTPNRQTGEKFRIVKTYMVHHLGMSILSVNNTLNENIIQNRFMRDCEMASFAELLQEKVPVGVPVLKKAPREIPEKPKRFEAEGWKRENIGVDIFNPNCCQMSNGAYNVLVTEAGQTNSVFGNICVTRFENLQTSLNGGMAFWLKSGEKVYSLMPFTNFDDSVKYKSEFSGNECRIIAEFDKFKSAVTISIPENENGEIRKIELESSDEDTKDCELFCFFEPVIERFHDYAAHPAFSRMLLEMTSDDNSITVHRRSRGKNRSMYLCFKSSEKASFSISKEKVFGRGSVPKFDDMVFENEKLYKSPSPDACVFASVKTALYPDRKSRISFAVSIANNELDAAEAGDRILKYKGNEQISRLDMLAARLEMKNADICRAFDLLTELTFVTEGRYRSSVPGEALTGQNELWKFGISGDIPIAAVSVNSEDDAESVKDIIKEHIFLTELGVKYDLVLLINDGGDYRLPIQRKISASLRTLKAENLLNSRGGVHFADSAKNDVSAILALSAKVIDINKPPENDKNRDVESRIKSVALHENIKKEKLTFGHNDDGSFYFNVQGILPKKTWSNMLSNDTFGFVATDAGTGHMWYLNARENKINRWLNDSLADVGTEQLYLLRNGRKISLFAAEDGHKTTVTYGFGWAKWEKEIDNTKTSVLSFVPQGISGKIFVIRCGNADENDKIAYCTDLVLNANEAYAPFVVTEYNDGIFSAYNASNTDYPDYKFRICADKEPESFTSDKIEWEKEKFSGKTGTNMLSCAGFIYKAEEELIIAMGCCDKYDLKKLTETGAVKELFDKTKAYWRKKVSPIKIKCGNMPLESYINGWALYQTLACRIKGRSSVYQSGGAYGFRDQLQDSCALIISSPEETKNIILQAAAHQYEEGDVQHWWHKNGKENDETDKGVRTRYSDDLLWLPYTLCRYAEKTGDKNFCNETAAYIKSKPLESFEAERYELPEKSDSEGTLLEHAEKAVNLLLKRGTGSHGLCHFGGGDWNDGMNTVGIEGKGESVWLTWFAAVVLRHMAKLLESFGRQETAAEYLLNADKLTKAADSAWDGKWYLRGYYDSGAKLGSNHNDECKIDSIAQSFAVPGGGNREKVKTALESAAERLIDEKSNVIRLFAPSFSSGEQKPGYIKSYAPGFRENGGQYTHGAIWLAMAMLECGMRETGYKILNMLLPQNHDFSVYGAEPFVLAADVYEAKGYEGRGGWSWYTGAAGWYYRAAVETLFGICFENGRLFVKPNLPESINGYEAELNIKDCKFKIRVSNVRGEIFVNEKPCDVNGYPVFCDGK